MARREKDPLTAESVQVGIDDYCRRQGKTYEELFYTGEEAAKRFAVAMKCMIRPAGKNAVALTPEEDAIREDIVANIDRANPSMGKAERVGGDWGDGVTVTDRRKRDKSKRAP